MKKTNQTYSVFAIKNRHARRIGVLDGNYANNAWRQLRDNCSLRDDKLISVNFIPDPHEDYAEEEVTTILLDVEEYLEKGWTVYVVDDSKDITSIDADSHSLLDTTSKCH